MSVPFCCRKSLITAGPPLTSLSLQYFSQHTMNVLSGVLQACALSENLHLHFYSFFSSLAVPLFNFALHLSQFLSKETTARDDIATEAYEEELDMGRSGSYLNNSITSAWSEHSLDPEDIRVRCYSQSWQCFQFKSNMCFAPDFPSG